ncbi:MAG: 4Fe-4S dicluster domain-containing protein [Planctomycetota bacterium]|jgi:carbon-monoxide dehydrogenase iron sulfur subunit
MDKTIAVNIEKCLACKSCEIACALAHSESKVLEEAVAESPRPKRRVTVEAAGNFAVPIQCRHCEDAPCITVCPTAAIHRHQANDPVLIDKERCIGCKFCLAVCPFGVIDITRDGKAVVKCDLCIERTKAGQEPACVEACPTGALKIVSEKELAAAKRKLAARELVLSTQNSKKQKQREDAQ